VIFKIHILFCGDNLQTVALTQTKIGQKIMDIPTSFICIVIFLTDLLNMAMVRNLEVMLGQTLNQFV
jgi:hypothetical protein